MPSARTLLALLWLAAAPLAQGSVLVTGSNEPGAYIGLQEAIDAASDGDIILVRALGSQQFTLSGKSLVIQGDAHHPPAVGATLSGGNVMGPGSYHNVVSDIGAGQVVVLRGLILRGLEIKDVQGVVCVEDCETWQVSPSLRATNCQSLILERDTLQGPMQFADLYFSQAGGRGGELIDTHAFLHDVIATGGDGSDFHCSMFGGCGNGSGYDALYVSGSTQTTSALISGGSLAGGHGGTGGIDSLGGCYAGGSGGNGLIMAGGWPIVTVQGTLLSGGTGAAGPAGPCFFGSTGNGLPGLPVSVLAGNYGTMSGSTAALTTVSPVREGKPFTAHIQAGAGNTVALILGTQPAFSKLGAMAGLLLAAPPLNLFFLGTLPASGELTLSASVPELGPGVQGVAFMLQLAVQPGPGSWSAGGGSEVVFFDAGL